MSWPNFDGDSFRTFDEKVDAVLRTGATITMEEYQHEQDRQAAILERKERRKTNA